MLTEAKTFFYGCAVVVIDAAARPLFWLIHWQPKR